MIDSMSPHHIPISGTGQILIPHLALRIGHSLSVRPRDTLARNLKSLMAVTPDRGVIAALSKASEVPHGTVGRACKADVNLGIDYLDPLAGAFGLQPWQLLSPALRPAHGTATTPKVAPTDWPFSQELQKAVLGLNEDAQTRLENVIRATLGMRPLVALTDEERLALFTAMQQPGLPDHDVERLIPATRRAQDEAKKAYEKSLTASLPAPKPRKRAA